jgi:hypothetical protein
MEPMGHTEDDLNKAVVTWIESHKAYKKFLVDTQALFEIFALTWRGPQRNLTEAFESYREALLAANGYSHSEVREFYPGRKPSTDSSSH